MNNESIDTILCFCETFRGFEVCTFVPRDWRFPKFSQQMIIKIRQVKAENIVVAVKIIAFFMISFKFSHAFHQNQKHPDKLLSSTYNSFRNRILTLFHMGGGGGADSALLQIVFVITSVRDAAEPRNLVTFPKI